MKSESNIKPTEPFNTSEPIDGIVTVEFFDIESIEEKETEDSNIHYEYDYYTLKIKDRPYLNENLKSNYQAWIQKAIDEESVSPKQSLQDKVVEQENIINDLVQLLIDKEVIF